MTREVKERYLTQVDQELIRQLQLRGRLMTEARKLVDQFAEENPEAGYEDLETAFGTPGEFAAEMLSTVPTEQVEAAKKSQKRQRRLVLGIVALALVVSALFFFWKWQKAQEVVKGDFRAVISPVEELTDEEMEAFMKAAPPDAQSHIGG